MADKSTRIADASVQDRQRDRAARGIKSRIPKASGQLPSPPRRRRPALAALAVLLIIGGAALSGLLALRLDSRDPVVLVNQEISVGTKITTEMLSTTSVASDKLLLVPENQINSVLGTYARTAITKGQLLDTSMLTTTAPSSADQIQVGIPLTSGHVPPDLRSGDQVRLVRISDGNSKAKPLGVGLILRTQAGEEGGSFSGGSSNSATVLVLADAADDVVDAAGGDVLGIALMKRGVSVDEAELTTLGSGL